jgi:hypothetical protein
MPRGSTLCISTHLERFLEGPEDAGTWFAFGVQQR